MAGARRVGARAAPRGPTASSRDEPRGSDGADELRYDPTVGVTAGLWSGGIHFGLPGDQRPDEALSLDVHRRRRSTSDVHVLGRPRAELHVTSSARVIGFCVSLADVRPDGTSHLVAKGMLNVTRRDSLREPAPLEPGEQAVLAVDLDTHRLGLPPRSPAARQRGQRRLAERVADARGRQRARCSEVPPRPRTSCSRSYLRAGARQRPISGRRPSSCERHASAAEPPTWRVSRDVLSGRAEVEIAIEGDVRVNDTTLVRRSFAGTMRADRADPARASAFGRHRARIVRPSGTTTSTSDLTIQATADYFHITLTVEVLQNDAPVFARRWIESVPRMLL